MTADEILDRLATLQNDVVVNEREHKRQVRRMLASVPGSLADEQRACEELVVAVTLRDAYLDAIRHHRLVQAHDSTACPLCLGWPR